MLPVCWSTACGTWRPDATLSHAGITQRLLHEVPVLRTSKLFVGCSCRALFLRVRTAAIYACLQTSQLSQSRAATAFCWHACHLLKPCGHREWNDTTFLTAGCAVAPRDTMRKHVSNAAPASCRAALPATANPVALQWPPASGNRACSNLLLRCTRFCSTQVIRDRLLAHQLA